MKKLCLALSVLLLIAILVSCVAAPSPGLPSSSAAPAVSSVPQGDDGASWPVYLKKSKIASQPASFIPIDEVGGFDPAIITKELLAKPSSLPDASVESIPYWTGFVIDNMATINFADARWKDLTDGSGNFYEENIKVIADEGFNCARVLYSLSYLSNVDDPLSINETQLKSLDELISWGIKYNVHIMLSITGLPGKGAEMDEQTKYIWPNEALDNEFVSTNNTLFSDTQLADLYRQYMAMLVSRYRELPSRYLSVELLAEPAVPDWDVTVYEDVLVPIVSELKGIDPQRIFIANDVAKQVPERLAEIGCALSLHNHIYSVDNSRFPEIEYQPTWPMQYFPGIINDPNQVLTLVSEQGFGQGTVEVYVNHLDWSKGGLTVKADGQEILSAVPDKSGWFSADLAQGVKKLTIGINQPGHIEINGVRVAQSGLEPVTLVRHDIYTSEEPNEMPTIMVHPDGALENISGQALDSDYFYRTYLKKFIDTTKKYNVGFLMTEVGTDTYSLSKEDYKAYESTWLKALRDNNIPWMYNCLHGVFAPQGSVQTDVAYSCGFTQIEQVPGTPFEKVTEIFEFLQSYR